MGTPQWNPREPRPDQGPSVGAGVELKTRSENSPGGGRARLLALALPSCG
jgi:hypothetical protein